MAMNREAAIGVFDSGVGGLTVAREIMRHLPNEKIIYFGDTARVPYGSKSKDTIIHYSKQIANFLETHNVKAIVIACNTASALAIEEVSQEVDVPVIGVVIPGARAALQETETKNIAVVATEATINSGLYARIIQDELDGAKVLGRACPLFVPIVEEGLAKHKVAEDMIEYYLADIKASEVDTLILGCTHYPLLRNRIRAYLGDSMHLVNPAYETAMDLKELLREKNLAVVGRELVDNESRDSHICAQKCEVGDRNIPVHEFYVSDGAEKFVKFANSILPYKVGEATKVNIEEY